MENGSIKLAKSEYWPIDKLKLWERNPRSIKKDRFNELKERIKRQGQIKPILVTEDGTVIGGNMRLRAFQELGVNDVWVSVTDAKTDREIFDLALTDNEEFGYYEQEQVAELALELGLSPLELKSYALQLGEPTTLDLIVDELGPEITEEDDEAPEVDELSDPVSKLGEIYQLGEHRLMCGSATEKADVDKLMDGKKADMVFTDPPYNVDYGSNQSPIWGKGRKILNDKMSDEEWLLFIDGFNEAAISHCSGAIYIAMSCKELDKVKVSFEEAGGHWSTYIIWKKQQLVPGRKDYQSMYEPILYGWPEAVSNHYFIDSRKEVDVWEIDRPARSEEHPTMKPVELCGKAITNSSRPGGTVLDLFGGSGSTLIAADKTNRTCYMMELDPKYCDVIRKRYAKLIGEEEEWQKVTPVVQQS